MISYFDINTVYERASTSSEYCGEENCKKLRSPTQKNFFGKTSKSLCCYCLFESRQHEQYNCCSRRRRKFFQQQRERMNALKTTKREKQQNRGKYLNCYSFRQHICQLLRYSSSTIISRFARLYGQLRAPLGYRPLLPLVLLAIALLLSSASVSDGKDIDGMHATRLPAIVTLGDNNATESKERLATYRYSTTVEREPIAFDQWINRTQTINGIFLNRSSYSEGEVLLFRTKKSRHRAIAVMRVAASPFTSKFSDALTFKEWLKSVYSQNKALKLSVRTTEVVRPVLQHLYASKGNFRAPIIIHANTFANSGRNLGSAGQIEKPVDAVVFINAVAEYLPRAVISLGWTQSADYAALNRFDWRQTFRLVDYIHHLHQPVILNMKLNDAVHSLAQLEWLLGVQSLSVFVILSGEMSDFVDDNASLRRLAALSASDAGHKILFNVDETWRQKIEHNTPTQQIRRKDKRSVEPENWTNLVFANAHEVLSTSLVSSQGVAFLGWPNSLLVSNRPVTDYPAKQRIAGRVMFLPKREARFVTIPKESGMVIQLFEGPIELVDATTPRIRDAIRIFIGYEGRVTIENTNRIHDSNSKNSDRKKWARGESNSYDRHLYYYYSYYHKSSIGQLPKRPCYDFEIVDRNWQIELNIQSIDCDPDDKNTLKQLGKQQPANGNYQLYLQLDVPVTRSKKTRRVAIGKSGDGAVDFIFHEITHNSSGTAGFNAQTLSFFIAMSIILHIRLNIFL